MIYGCPVCGSFNEELRNQILEAERENARLTNHIIATDRANDRMSSALRKIIEWNYQQAEHQYGDKNKAENWACVRAAREALGETVITVTGLKQA